MASGFTTSLRTRAGLIPSLLSLTVCGAIAVIRISCSTFYERPGDNLRIWDDQIAAAAGSYGTAGNDAHANVGLSLNDALRQVASGFQTRSRTREVFAWYVCMYCFRGTDHLTLENLLSAIRDGHCFIAFDLFGDTTGFRFQRDQRRREQDSKVIRSVSATESSWR